MAGHLVSKRKERKKAMAIQKDPRKVFEPVDWEAPNQSPKQTSVSAHTILSIAVQMSTVEMDALIESFGVADVNLSDTQRTIQREFADAVRALR
jgi:hypothetical protein